MKKLTLILMVIINTNVFAQKQEAFFSSDSAGIKNIANLVIENTKNKYQLDRVISQKRNVEFWYRNDLHTLIRIHFQIFFEDSTSVFILKGLTGNYEDIFPFWKKYFQEDADMGMIEKAGSSKSASLSFLKDGIIYSFRKGGSLWQISPYSKANPSKK